MSKVIITNFTDPLCPWCWGEEPYLRKIETHFPGQIEFRYVMGGLIEDLNKKKPTDETPESYYRKINISTARHLLETAQKHKMPIGTTDFQLYSETESSSYPTNIAFKAAEKANAGKAEFFLYNLRAAAMAEAKPAIKEDELIGIADATGIDLADFLEAMNDESTREAFQSDLQFTEKENIEVFPTFIIEYENKQMKLANFRDYKTLVAFIKTVSGGAVTPIPVTFSPESLFTLMEKHPKMAAEEVKEAFDFTSIDEMEQAIRPLLDRGELIKQSATYSYFVKLPSQGMFCDLTTGICK